jgi:hypothetical protein
MVIDGCSGMDDGERLFGGDGDWLSQKNRNRNLDKWMRGATKFSMHLTSGRVDRRGTRGRAIELNRTTDNRGNFWPWWKMSKNGQAICNVVDEIKVWTQGRGEQDVRTIE